MAVVREDVVKMSFDVDMGEVSKLASTLDDVKETLTGGLGDDAFDEMVKESKKANKSLNEVKESVNGIKPEGIEDTAKGLKEAEKEGGDAFKQLKKIASTSFGKTVSGLKSITTTLGKVGIAAGKVLAKGIAAGVAGVGALVYKAVTNYADYEQLVGGVDTLFKDSSGTVQKYADEAYKTAGLSANDYMSTVTSFSASLIQSLGGDTGKAAELSNMAIIDMADNANKMGTDMSSIQDAYQGFAKQNYTMLDNLKLGYGGTQEEMKRLLKDAEAISGVHYDISSYADIVSAIHVIQENMGIAGTTSKEAGETISGSFASMRAAWGNTLTSLILGGDDFDRNIDNLVESAKTFGKNIMPALVKGLGGIGDLIEELSPLIEENLPIIVDTLLPPLIKAATSIIKGLIIALPDIISTIIDEIPEILKQVWSGISEAFGDVPGISKVGEFFGKLQTFFTENAGTIKTLVPAAIGLVVAFKLFNKVKGISGLFGAGKGGGGGGFFGGLANIQPTKALKGMANLAIVIGGLALLAAAIMWAAPYMAQLTDAKSLTEVLVTITLVGLVGSALAGLAGLIGAFPVTTVLTGLANIALALGGFSAIVVAFGALTQIDGFTEFLSKGGEVLAEICRIIGEMAGSIIGGLAEGITNSLPAIGDNLSAFAESLKPMFETFAGVDASGLSDFAGALAAFIAVIAGEKIVSVITGGIDYADLGNKLSTMATSLSTFFSTIMTFPDGSFEKATALFNCLAGISSMPKDGGVVGWFEGEVDYTKMATGLNALAGAVGFFTAIQSIPDEAFTKATSLFDCLAGIKSLPQDGGVVGWFMGEVNFESIATGIQALASAGMITALTAIAALPENAFTGLKSMFDALAGIKAMPKEGGIAGWFSGDSSTGLTNVASQLPGVATNIASFFTNLGGRTDFTPIKSLFDTLSSIEIDSDAANGTGLFGWGASQLESMGTGLSNFATNAATFFSKINNLNLANLTGFFSALETVGDLPTTLATLDTSIGTALSNMVTNTETKMGEMSTAISNGLTTIVGMMDATATAMYTSGAAIMDGLNNGMLSKKKTLVSTAKSMAAAIQKAFDIELDINSPSKVMEGKGMDTAMGQVVGMQKGIPYVESAAQDVARASIPYTSKYTPETDSSTIYNNGGNSEHTTIAPVFNLTISGTQDDRATARKVKQYVAQAIRESFDSLSRKNPVLREV